MRTRTMIAVVGVLLLLIGSVPAGAQETAGARASAFGAQVFGLVDPTPEVTAEIPPGDADEQSEALVEIPADPLLLSATASVTGIVSAIADIEAALQDKAEGVNPDLPADWNASGFAVTEDLEALDALLTADVLAAEALVSCVDGTPTFASASEIENLTLADEEIPLEDLGDALTGGLDPLVEALDPVLGESSLALLTDEPNDVVLDLPDLGLRVIAWETNWDSATGTLDGSDTVWVNALRIEIDEPLASLLEPIVSEPTDILISHSEATADCDAIGPRPTIPISKEASDSVVAPGDTFTYTITIPNPEDCTLTDVMVVDTITGPDGSEIVATDPAADVDGLTITWEDVGPIGPGEQVVLTVDVRVPDDAPDGALYQEELRMTADCDGDPIDGAVDFDGPRVAVPDAPQPDLPRTGAAAVLPLGAGLLLAGAAVALGSRTGTRRT